MKTNWLDRLEKTLARHGGKGFLSYLVSIAIFLVLSVYVLLIPLFNFLTLNKLKLK